MVFILGYLIWDVEADVSPVGIQSGLELVQGGGGDDFRWESIPVVNHSHTETISSDPGLCLLFA